MKFIYKMELVLIVLISILCSILLFKLLYKLRSVLPWRTNCWFCNSNFWLKFRDRNSWLCPGCDQYNGFTKDGDYNKPIFTSKEQAHKSTMVFQHSPPKNGLCKMCNINQQLKVAQLANFVPMNDKNYDEEIDSYKLQLEKAYKLCNPCKKVLQMKLHKEKETLLGSKLLETRTPEKRYQKHVTYNTKLKSFTNNSSMFIAGILLVLVSVDFYQTFMKYQSASSTIANIKEIATGLLDRVIAIIKMKTKMTFPLLEDYINAINNTILDIDLPIKIPFSLYSLDKVNVMTQKSLGGFVCLIQIFGLIWNVNKLKHTLVIDLVWSIFVISSIAHDAVAVEPIVMSLVKFLSIVSVLVTYRSIKTKVNKLKPATKQPTTPKRMKNLTSRTLNSVIDSEESLSMDTDDDVSLSKFGLPNFSDSNETISPLNTSHLNGRSFTPRSNDSMWSKPKLNSTFCVNSVLKSPSSISESVFIKPTFSKYQKLAKSDSDSDLDESIGSLCISSPKKNKKKGESIFSLRKFTATPNFVAPSPLVRSRPLISPSKLGHSTSWVAGGYWGSEADRQLFSVDGSRSSSQSSGFESQASSATQRNIFSHPPSREESMCGEPDRSTLLDRFQNCNMNNYGNIQTPQNFSRMSSPVFPQMQFNGHVHIPQPRLAQQNVFAQQQYVQNNMFKAPAGSGLIKLPQNSFASR